MNETEQLKGAREDDFSKRQPIKEYLKERVRDIPLTVCFCLYTCFCLFSLVYFPIIGRIRDMGISALYILFAVFIYVAEWSLNIRVPKGYAVLLYLFLIFNFLGASYNMYNLIPYLDDALHAVWGIVFGIVGITVIKAWLGLPKTKKAVVIYVIFGLGFAVILSVCWEIFEFSGDSVIADMDMQQDKIVSSIHSFMMWPDPADPSPDGLNTWQVEGIAKTVLYDADGNVLGTIYGGYLDLGLYDTMYDLIFCMSFIAVFSVVLAIDWCKGKYVYRFFIPALRSEIAERKAAAAPENAENAAPHGEETAGE